MNFAMPQFSLALPEIFLLCMIGVILLADLFLGDRHRMVTYLLTQLTLILTFFLTLPQFGEYPIPIVTFSGHYVVDKLAIIAKLFTFLFSVLVFAYTRDYCESRKIAMGDYYLLGMLSILGMSVMASAYSFLTLYLGLELLSLPLYAMVAMHKNSNESAEAAMKYVVLGALASGLLLYGISILYGVTGQIQINVIGQILQAQNNIVPIVGLVFIAAGLLFKFGAVPFHMWVPDVYQGAATPTTLLIASVPKLAAFVITVRAFVEAMPTLQAQWISLLIVASVLSMFLGNLLAIAQSNLKRMLAYSSIAHIGYTLLGLIAGPHSSNGYSAAMFYIATYVLVAAGAFAIIAIMSRQGIEFDKLEDYRGLNARSPWLAFVMLLLLFSMAGVPPTVGFFAKLGLLEALVEAKLVWLAVLALIFAIIGAYYYLRVVMLMYFEEPTDTAMNTPIVMSYDTWVAISVNGAAVLFLGLLPSYFIDLCRISVG